MPLCVCVGLPDTLEVPAALEVGICDSVTLLESEGLGICVGDCDIEFVPEGVVEGEHTFF